MYAVNTDEIPVRERVGAWREAVSRAFVPLEVDIDEDASFEGTVRTETLGDLRVSLVAATPHRAARTDALCAHGCDSLLKVGMPICGTATVAQDGRIAVVHAGDVVLYDTTRPYDIDDATGGFLVMVLPSTALGLPTGTLRTLTCRPVAGDRGIGAVFSPMLKGLADNLDQLTTFQPDRLGEHVLESLRTMYAELLSREGYRPEDPGSVIRARIHAVIGEHLSDPWLSPDAIAAACFISTGYLHKLFRAEGTTVSAYIRTKRLAACRRALLDPANWNRPIGAIGAEAGFVDAAHFSRVFKNEFSMGPRDFRAVAMAGTADREAG